MNAFEQLAGAPLTARSLDVLQINVGLTCDLACKHCHLKAGPHREERMTPETMDRVVEAARAVRPALADVTGGAPELNPHLPRLLKALADLGLRTKVRTNLTALFTPGADIFFDLYASLGVHLTASLPCYLDENVAALRGPGVHAKCVEALRRLNAKGYAQPGGPELELVFNPGVGLDLPPSQACLEPDYRRELWEKHRVVFTRLITLANMPLGRFRETLAATRQERAYRDVLRANFNPATLPGLMCKTQVSVGPDGSLYDCDFNLALGLPINHGAPGHIDRFDPEALVRRTIVTGSHCLGCAAGAGSSCSGALT